MASIARWHPRRPKATEAPSGKSDQRSPARLTIGPWSHPFFRWYRAILPTSLTHIDYCLTIDSKPWRPDEVYGTDTALEINNQDWLFRTGNEVLVH